MFSIINRSDESLRLDVVLDKRDPNLRVVAAPEPQTIDPGQEISMLGYEPGTLLRIVPGDKPEDPRTLNLIPKPVRMAVSEELVQLDRLRGRLQAIINSSKAFQYSAAHKALLQTQLQHMTQYALVLQARITLLDQEAEAFATAQTLGRGG